MNPKARADIAKIKGEVSDLFLAAGVPIGETELNSLLAAEIEEVAQVFIRVRTAKALALQTDEECDEEDEV